MNSRLTTKTRVMPQMDANAMLLALLFGTLLAVSACAETDMRSAEMLAPPPPMLQTQQTLALLDANVAATIQPAAGAAIMASIDAPRPHRSVSIVDDCALHTNMDHGEALAYETGDGGRIGLGLSAITPSDPEESASARATLRYSISLEKEQTPSHSCVKRALWQKD